MNHQRTGFTPVPTHQDGATVSAFQFDRRIEHLQCWRRRGHRFNKRRWNDLEGLFSKGASLNSVEINISSCRQSPQFKSMRASVN